MSCSFIYKDNNLMNKTTVRIRLLCLSSLSAVITSLDGIVEGGALEIWSI